MSLFIYIFIYVPKPLPSPLKLIPVGIYPNHCFPHLKHDHFFPIVQFPLEEILKPAPSDVSRKRRRWKNALSCPWTAWPRANSTGWWWFLRKETPVLEDGKVPSARSPRSPRCPRSLAALDPLFYPTSIHHKETMIASKVCCGFSTSSTSLRAVSARSSKGGVDCGITSLRRTVLIGYSVSQLVSWLVGWLVS